ncbi:MAG TPA: hypothetical protein ACFE0H_02765 [Elainellaceae cyanobacterium]
MVIGCSLGDDAEERASRGFEVTAFAFHQRRSPGAQSGFPIHRLITSYQTYFSLIRLRYISLILCLN